MQERIFEQKLAQRTNSQYKKLKHDRLWNLYITKKGKQRVIQRNHNDKLNVIQDLYIAYKFIQDEPSIQDTNKYLANNNVYLKKYLIKLFKSDILGLKYSDNFQDKYGNSIKDYQQRIKIVQEVPNHFLKLDISKRVFPLKGKDICTLTDNLAKNTKKDAQRSINPNEYSFK